MVSVIVPCRNAAATLGEQLDALSRQTYEGAWEVVVVDNGSSDASAEIARSYADRLPGMRVHETPEAGVSRVRNAGVRVAAGDLLAFADADDVVSTRWLEALVSVAHDADIVGGRLDDLSLNSRRVVQWRGQMPQEGLLRPLNHLPFAPGGNCAVWRDVFETLGGWDPSFVAGSDDVDFCWRAAGRGYRIGYAPDAVTAYRYRDSLMAVCKQYFRYGFTEVQLYRRFRADGVERGSIVGMLKVWWALLKGLGRVARRQSSAGAWLRELSHRAGRLWGSVRLRALLP